MTNELDVSHGNARALDEERLFAFAFEEDLPVWIAREFDRARQDKIPVSSGRDFDLRPGRGAGDRGREIVFVRRRRGTVGAGLSTTAGGAGVMAVSCLTKVGPGVETVPVGVALACAMVGVGATTAIFFSPAQLLRATTMTSTPTSAAPMRRKRGLMGAGRGLGGGIACAEVGGETSGASVATGGGSGGGVTTLTAPQSGQAGRFTGS